jgi:hypothetical protein
MTKKTVKIDIYETTDYDIFKKVVGNRPVFTAHVDKLRRSIQRKNMLERNPIKVNEKMQIIDGQHRLEAARQLSLPIYYLIEPEGGLSEIQLLNANNRSWLTSDYLESFIAMGRREYMQLRDFAEEYRISISIAMQVLSQRYNDHDVLLREFREGKFTVGDIAKAENTASLIGEVRRHSPDYAWSHRPCMRALAILEEKGFAKQFGEQLDRYQQVVTRRTSVKDYLRQFELILGSGIKGRAATLSN